ncbi:hypothetical protein [Alteribacillus iranensis]|nr:hypothetical protein [Alteribacillus iranensis]
MKYSPALGAIGLSRFNPLCGGKATLGPHDVGQFDVITGTSAGGGGFYVAHTMWAVLVEVPFSLVELPSPALVADRQAPVAFLIVY